MLVIMIQCAGVARACGPTLKLVRCALLATEDGAAGLVRHPAMLMKCVCVCVCAQTSWGSMHLPLQVPSGPCCFVLRLGGGPCHFLDVLVG